MWKVIALFSFAQQADVIIGKYHLTNNYDVEIFESNKKYYGKIIALIGYKNGQIKDIKNPNISKRDDLLIGKLSLNIWNLAIKRKNGLLELCIARKKVCYSTSELLKPDKMKL